MVGSAEGAAGLAGARRAVRLIFAGGLRRTGFRRESPLSNTERGCCGGPLRLLIVRSWMLSRVGARRVPPPPQPSVVGDQRHSCGRVSVGCGRLGLGVDDRVAGSGRRRSLDQELKGRSGGLTTQDGHLMAEHDNLDGQITVVAPTEAH